jgi:hypothetical protein
MAFNVWKTIKGEVRREAPTGSAAMPVPAE